MFAVQARVGDCLISQALENVEIKARQVAAGELGIESRPVTDSNEIVGLVASGYRALGPVSRVPEGFLR